MKFPATRLVSNSPIADTDGGKPAENRGTRRSRSLYQLRIDFRWLVLLLLPMAIACQPAEPDPSTSDGDASGDIEERLVLENATLDKADETGAILWQINAELVEYAQDREVASLKELTGNLYEAGEVTLQVRARQGTIVEDGDRILLEGEIVAIDPRNEVTIRAEEAEWFPEDALLAMRENLRGEHPQLRVTAAEGHYRSDTQQLELAGEVKAIATEPALQLQAETLTWDVVGQEIASDRPLQIDRFVEEELQERARAQQAQINLETKIVTLETEVELKAIAPPLQVTTDAATWNPDARMVTSDRPVQVVRLDENLSITGNRGEIDLDANIITFSEGVEGRNTESGATLFAERLRWDLDTQRTIAQGKVTYKQFDPPLTTTGESAEGQLAANQIVVKSSGDRQVVTEIVP